MKIKNFGVIGCGNIATEHSYVAKKLGLKLIGCYTRNFSSKNWKNYTKRFPEVNKYTNIDNLINDNNIDIITCAASWDKIPYILPKLLSSKKIILIEKPISFSSKDLKKDIKLYKKNLSNKYIGYNRRFYNSTNQLLLRIKKGGLLSAKVQVTENLTNAIKKFGKKIKNKIFYVSSTSHIIDLCLFLFGRLNLKYSKSINSKRNNSYHFVGNYINKEKKLVQISIINENPTETGITCYFDDGTTWVLSPLENLRIYNKYLIREYSKKNKIRIYTPNLIKNKVEKSKYKPGFYEQLRTITQQDKKKLKNIANVYDSLELIEFLEELKK